MGEPHQSSNETKDGGTEAIVWMIYALDPALFLLHRMQFLKLLKK